MASVKFLIRFPSQEEPQAIYVTYRFGRNDKLMYATPLRTESVFWDADRQRVRNSRYCRYADDINNTLAELLSALEKFIMGIGGERTQVSKHTMRSFLDTYFMRAKKDSGGFHDFFDKYTEECDTRMNGRRGGQVVTYKTKREYARTHHYIKMYERKRKVVLDFQDIDQRMMGDFVAFLQGLNLATNTIAHKVITLKALMRAAVERGLTDNTRWQFYRNATEETYAVSLDEGELERVRRCNLSRHKYLEKIRDLFLVCCWTGLRYSDVTALRAEHIHGGMIVIQQSKTNNYVTIPLHPVVREIWERYDGIPRAVSNQKFNEYIKKVCKAAYLRERVLKSITRGGKKRTTAYEKWQLVTSHTGRRSFATNLYKSGFPAISIMQITGHRTEAAFLKYIKVTREEHARLLAEHWNKNR